MKNKTGRLIAIILLVVVLVFGGLILVRNIGKSNKEISEADARRNLARIVRDIGAKTGTPVKGQINFDSGDTTFQELPDLSDSSVIVRPDTSLYAEIFASSEKTGADADGYLREMVTKFNNSNLEINGTPVSVMLRNVASGQQVDYVASGKYVPTAISPSSSLSVKMLNAKGVATEYAAESLVMNYAGIVLSKSTYSTLVEEYGAANVQTLAKATAEDKVIMGYTNPFTSATGLNFLITLLDSYSSGSINSQKAIDGFVSFQKNIPFVAMTTQQMRSAAEKGTFGAFVMEYQTYINDRSLSQNYRFIPFGYAHDNPLAMISSAPEEEKAILRMFADFCEQNGKDLAKRNGFNTVPEGYVEMTADYSGAELVSAQALYKENKDVRPIVAVFVADVSGSMDGSPLNALQNSLVNSMQYINNDNYIGLVSYNQDVRIELPIAKFDLTQQSYFLGTVQSLTAGGSTATFDAICVAMDMMLAKMEEIPDAKPMIFVLSDGETNRGNSLSDIRNIVAGLQMPIYTIGYNANIDALKEISEINEAVCINAGTEDIAYQLRQLFNANM
ncbi:MAG: VWA domain-containing protein [Clostridia bacterium]|nr:VWA domain-containing protein [Clostridia bacterium]